MQSMRPYNLSNEILKNRVRDGGMSENLGGKYQYGGISCQKWLILRKEKKTKWWGDGQKLPILGRHSLLSTLWLR